MTRADQERQKRQMNRRIREVLAVRRMLRSFEPPLDTPVAGGAAPPHLP